MKAAETVRELMNVYNEKRAEWIAEYGGAVGFDEWFTLQVDASGIRTQIYVDADGVPVLDLDPGSRAVADWNAKVRRKLAARLVNETLPDKSGEGAGA
jgi:hypothetical protein